MDFSEEAADLNEMRKRAAEELDHMGLHQDCIAAERARDELRAALDTATETIKALNVRLGEMDYALGRCAIMAEAIDRGDAVSVDGGVYTVAKIASVARMALSPSKIAPRERGPVA